MLDITSEYTALHARGYFSGGSVHKFIDQILPIFVGNQVVSVLDYGSGKGEAHKNNALGKTLGVAFTLFDPYVDTYVNLPGMSFDAVMAIDVAEHVPMDALPEFFKNIFGHATKCAIISFCNRPAKKTFSDGTNVHVTQRPAEWWEKEAAKYNINNIPVYILETI